MLLQCYHIHCTYSIKEIKKLLKCHFYAIGANFLLFPLPRVLCNYMSKHSLMHLYQIILYSIEHTVYCMEKEEKANVVSSNVGKKQTIFTLFSIHSLQFGQNASLPLRGPMHRVSRHYLIKFYYAHTAANLKSHTTLTPPPLTPNSLRLLWT